MEVNVILLFVVSGVVGFIVYFFTSKRLTKKIGDFKSIDQAIAEHLKTFDTVATNVKDATNELNKLKKSSQDIFALRDRADELSGIVKQRTQELEQMKDSYSDLQQLKSELDLYSRIEDFVDYGLFEEPEYLYETSERYAIEIKKIREQQKELIKNKVAIELPDDDISIDGSSKSGNAVLDGQSKMMLKSFNIECDYLIGKLNAANFARTIDQIENAAEKLEKLSATLLCGFNTEYVKLKYEECKLQYQYQLKKQEEIEEQKAIKEQMREEEKARREFEKAIRDAEKEEKMYADLLEKAKAEIEIAREDDRAMLSAKIEMLQQQLLEAQEKETRAKSMAEQTRRGHVYIISNIGSFGENVYKIGLTRRLEPLDRVRELGDASVPFQFDVHAMIYSEDAPAMEAALHREFDRHRVNAVNRRKEFFNISLDEIRTRIEKMHSKDAEFKMTALAEEYYETLRLLGN